jgi:hypothetical protein
LEDIKKEGQAMNIREIPKILFEEFSKLGRDKEWKYNVPSFNYRLIELEPKAVGFAGTIGFGDIVQGVVRFSVWSTVIGREDMIFNPNTIFEISSFSHNKREVAEAILNGPIRDGYSCASLENPAMKFVAKVIERAVDLMAMAEKN